MFASFPIIFLLGFYWPTRAETVEKRLLEAEPATFRPFFVQIVVTNEEEKFCRCGGTLIGEQLVLTAAMCFAENEYAQPENILLTLSNSALSEDYLEVSNVKIHDDYERLYRHDLALVHLKEPVSPKYVLPICWRGYTTYPNLELTLSGMGRTDSKKVPNQLMEVTVRQLGCEINYDKKRKTCTVGTGWTSSKRYCKGDIGGPLFESKNGKAVCLFGVASQREGMNRGGCHYYMLHTLVQYYTKWIEHPWF